MTIYKDFAEAQSHGAKGKREYLQNRIEELRARSALPPDETEIILSAYRAASLRNFEISERNQREILAMYRPNLIQRFIKWLTH